MARPYWSCEDLGCFSIMAMELACPNRASWNAVTRPRKGV
jgi:hypothetical protein